jgi:hypothetical protein
MAINIPEEYIKKGMLEDIQHLKEIIRKYRSIINVDRIPGLEIENVINTEMLFNNRLELTVKILEFMYNQSKTPYIDSLDAIRPKNKYEPYSVVLTQDGFSRFDEVVPKEP